MILAILLLMVHLLLAIIILFLSRTKLVDLYPAEMPLLFFLPYVGECVVVIISIAKKSGLAGRNADDLETMSMDSLMATDYIVPEQDDNQAIPLEDALILNDSKTRREVMLDMLLSQPTGYMPSLRQARMDSDVEVVHYATTAMTEASKQYELKLQRASVEYRKNPESMEALDIYIDVLERFIDDKMAEGELLEIYRGQLIKLLESRIEKKHRKEDYLDLVRCQLDSGAPEQAEPFILYMENKWKRWEGTLWCRIRYLFETNQGEAMKELLEKEKEEGLYTSQEARDMLAFWEKS